MEFSAFSSWYFIVVQLLTELCLTVCDPMEYPMDYHTRIPCSSLSPCSNSCPLSQWYYLNISSYALLFNIFLHCFPASGSSPMNQLFGSGGQSIGASAPVLPMNIQDWFPLGWTGLISLQSKGLSRVFSNTTVKKHQFFGAQPSLWSSSHIRTWLLEKPWLWLYGPLSAK